MRRIQRNKKISILLIQFEPKKCFKHNVSKKKVPNLQQFKKNSQETIFTDTKLSMRNVLFKRLEKNFNEMNVPLNSKSLQKF